ncbi:MAG: alternative oxidase [Sandarakinorhabdus sp.]|nr:alternative oxidase [Sandarakinorhabdus sp.]
MSPDMRPLPGVASHADIHSPATLRPAAGHRPPRDLSDRIAWRLTRLLRWIADRFFAGRYGHRAVVLETVAAVPGMVAGMLVHLKCLRRMEPDRGWIRKLLLEAENERMHLMTFVAIARPNALERAAVLMAQGMFFNCFFLLYLLHPRTAHRLVGYFEEEAVISYTQFLHSIDAGHTANVPAPQIAIDYWQLPAQARLRDVVLAVRADEASHRDANHHFADLLDEPAKLTGRAGTEGRLEA